MAKLDAERVKRIESFHEQVVLIMSFIGAIVFAGLVLVVGNPNSVLNAPTAVGGTFPPEQYLLMLTGILAFLSGFCAITAFMSLRALTLKFSSERAILRMYKVVKASTNIVLTLLVFTLVALVDLISDNLALVVGITLLASFAIVMTVGHWHTSEFKEPEER